MAGWIKKVKAFQFKGILVILGCFLLIGAILFAERSGLSYREKAKKLTYLDADKVVTEENAVKTLKPTCLVLTDSSQANSTMAWIQFEQIFKDMKVGTDLVDVNHESIPDDLSDYETVVVLLSDLSPLKENVLKISDWVKEGGSAMFALTLQKDTYVSLIRILRFHRSHGKQHLFRQWVSRRRRKSIQSHRRLRIGLGSGAESACKGIRLGG